MTNATVAGRRVWLIAGSVVAVAMLALGTMQAVSALAHEQETIVEVIDDASVRSLEVHSPGGTVRVVGGPRGDIEITADIDHGLRRTGHEVTVAGDRAVVRSTCPELLSTFCNIDYTIEVPADLEVVVRAHGSVRLSGLMSRVDVDTDGTIEVDGLSGDVRLATEDGSIDGLSLSARTIEADNDHGSVRLRFAEPPRTVIATTDHGTVEVVLPETDVTYRVEVSTDHGTPSTQVRTDPEADRSITADSNHGDVTVRYG